VLEIPDQGSAYGWSTGAGTNLSERGNWGVIKKLRETTEREHTYIFEYRYCNRKCPYCSGMCFPDGRYAEEEKAELVFPDVVPGAGTSNVCICGGEPFIDADFAAKTDEWLTKNETAWHSICVLTAVNFRTVANRPLFAVLEKWKKKGKNIACAVTLNGYPQWPHGHQVHGTAGWGYALNCVRELREAGFNVMVSLLTNSNTLAALKDLNGCPVSLFSIQHLNEHNYTFSKRIGDDVFDVAQAEHDAFHRDLQFGLLDEAPVPDMTSITDFGLFAGRDHSIMTKIAWDTVYPISGMSAWNHWPHGHCASCPAKGDDVACLSLMGDGCEGMYGHHCLICPAFKICGYSKPANTNCCDKNGKSFCDNIRRDVAASLALRFRGLSIDYVRGLLKV